MCVKKPVNMFQVGWLMRLRSSTASHDLMGAALHGLLHEIAQELVAKDWVFCSWLT